MKEAEQFRLALKGWEFKATLNDWHYIQRDDRTYSWNKIIVGQDGHGEVEIPPHVIVEKRRVNGKVVVFLENQTCYALGTERNGKEEES
jgi:hypothetical protein